MINDSLLSTLYKFHDHKQKNMKAFKKFLFPLKFKIFEIRGFDSTATIFGSMKTRSDFKIFHFWYQKMFFPSYFLMVHVL